MDIKYDGINVIEEDYIDLVVLLQMTQSTAVKICVYDNGDTKVQTQGIVSDSEMKKIREFIKENYKSISCTKHLGNFFTKNYNLFVRCELPQSH